MEASSAVRCKSSHSGNNGRNYIEAADLVDRILVRHTKGRRTTVLSALAVGWCRFTTAHR
jgi:hypothetical protein